ncbi:MAG: FkbM family methyltransferase [Bacteriovorax sp.]|nr:FkbM family methyltransferase [Bacteriovorax sp.]
MKADYEYPLNYFTHKLNLTKGKFVDVGANDGIIGSMTYELENQGWSGILIEPNPKLAQHLKLVRTSPVFQNAISSNEGELDFYIVEGPGNLHGLSRFHYTQEFGNHVIKSGGAVHKTAVQVRKISNIMNEAENLDHVDFLKIDVEGHEHEVLKSFDFVKFRPALIVTEDNFKDSDKSVRRFLHSKGYAVIARDRINYWFAPKCQIKHFLYDYLHAKVRFLRWDIKRFFYRMMNKKIKTGNN